MLFCLGSSLFCQSLVLHVLERQCRRLWPNGSPSTWKRGGYFQAGREPHLHQLVSAQIPAVICLPQIARPCSVPTVWYDFSAVLRTDLADLYNAFYGVFSGLWSPTLLKWYSSWMSNQEKFKSMSLDREVFSCTRSIAIHRHGYRSGLLTRVIPLFVLFETWPRLLSMPSIRHRTRSNDRQGPVNGALPKTNT